MELYTKKLKKIYFSMYTNDNLNNYIINNNTESESLDWYLIDTWLFLLIRKLFFVWKKIFWKSWYYNLIFLLIFL